MKKSKANKIYPYLMSIALVAITTLLCHFVKEKIEPANLVIFYLLIVVIAAVWWGRYPSVMTSVLSVIAFDYFLVRPYLDFTVYDIQYLFTFAGLLIVGLVVSALASTTREQGILAKEREAQTSMLYRLSNDLASSDSFETVLHIIRMNVGEIFDCQAAIFIPINNKIEPVSFDPDFLVNEHEQSIAAWVFKSGNQAGRGTDALQAANALYLPIKTSQGISGVLGVSFKEDKISLDPKEDNLLNALASQAAVALQRAKLAEVSRQMELIREREKLQTALLNSISHDLRTPLVSITGALSTMSQDFPQINTKTHKELIDTAYGESEHLNILVGNLLDMTRVEAGTLKLRIKPCELRDVIGTSLQPLKDKLSGRDLQINIPKDLPDIPIDFTLMMRVFVNLIDNAIKYSDENMPIEITAKLLEGEVKIEIKDRGFGIPTEDLAHIFDKFYRAVKPRQITGTGLGLSICKGIIEAHSGRIYAENNLNKGATLIVVLPLCTSSKEHG